MENDLSGWDFSGQDLTNAQLSQATLTDTNLAGATVTGADFAGPGITKEQLYSPASYQHRNLQGIVLDSNDLSEWNFTGQDLTNARLDRPS